MLYLHKALSQATSGFGPFGAGKGAPGAALDWYTGNFDSNLLQPPALDHRSFSVIYLFYFLPGFIERHNSNRNSKQGKVTSLLI